jgi:hypothetical protein
MCDRCIPILGARARAHPNKECVVARTLYCSLCCVNGHSEVGCPEKELRQFRESSNIIVEEVLIINIFPKDFESTVYVTDDDEGQCIRAMLVANNIVPMACQEKGRREGRDIRENKQRLINFMKRRNKKIVFLEPNGKSSD